MTSMPSPAPIVTIFGGSGFVGRYIARRMAKAGWRIRVAVRRPNEALFVRAYGVVGQVEPVQANIRDDASTRRAIAGASAVVNCVGILVENGRQNFDAVQDEGATRVARIAAEEGATRFVQISAIGADSHSPSAYARSKAAGEAAVQAAFPGAVILRPSVIFGTEDGFFNKLAFLSRLSPVMPVVAAETRFQPVYVDDVAAAAERALTTGAEPGIYELGGPETLSFREVVNRMLKVVERKRAVIALPLWVAQAQGRIFDLLQKLTFGLVTNRVITSDQVKLLETDNVVSPAARGLADLGVTPTAMDAVLASYLYSYRPDGQYAWIRESVERQES